MNTDRYINNNYPESELTSKIIDCAFKIYNCLGYGLPEKTYQRAMAEELKKSNINFSREKYGTIKYNDIVVGKYFLDFLIEDKIAVEFKVRNEIYIADQTQLLNYLKSRKLKVGVLLVISKSGVKIKRIIN